MLLAERLMVVRPVLRPDCAVETRVLSDASWRELVRSCQAAEMSSEQTEDHVAETMFYDALAAGGGESDIGLYGPRLVRRDARALVATELRARLQ